MADGQADDIRREIEARSNAAVETVIRDCYSRIAEHVGKMAERLKAYRPAVGENKAEGVFRDSLVENVRDLVGLLPALNITSDPALAQIASRMAVLCQEDASALRDLPSVRESVARDADAILADVTAFLA
jgi:hypothetical protein